MEVQINDQKIVDCIFGGFRNLVHIKGQYFNTLSDDPDHRARVVPMMVGFNKPIVMDVQAQLRYSVGDSIEATSVTQVSDMVTDYNTLLNLWMLRNRYYGKLMPSFKQEISSELIMKGFDALDYAHLVDVTELVIGYTDKLLLDKKNFLSGRNVFKLANKRKDLLPLCVPVHQLKYQHIIDTLGVETARAS